MIDRTKYLLATALLLAPMAALAQHGPSPASHTAPMPAVAPAAAQVPGGALADAGIETDTGTIDELLALGFTDELAAEPGDPDGNGEASAMDDAAGPGGQRRVVVRDIERGPGGMGMRGMMGRPMTQRRMAMRFRLAQLDLSDAQRTKLRDLRDAHARRAIQRRADVQLARLDLRKLMNADTPSTAAVNAQIDKLARLRADGLKSAFELRMQARAVLTPEQLKQLRSPMMPMRRGMMDSGPDLPRR